ncbi:hypothetical protein MHBO_002349 [Bonamia ostreae]|uniref:Uncharacterized protein n=1 Tax=Bonamia ostreae TaxID=126728 RepID=A0ABV2AM14_9EUKA
MAIVKDVRVNEFFFDLRKKEQSPKDFALTTTDFLFKIVNFSKALTVADQIAEIKSISSSVVLIKRNGSPSKLKNLLLETFSCEDLT